MHRFLAVIITCVGLFLRCQSKTATTVTVKNQKVTQSVMEMLFKWQEMPLF